VSVGVAVYPEDGTTIDTLLQAADRAFYKMKDLEKNPGPVQGVTDLMPRARIPGRAGQH
jgi:GGDEF domain-containing protein